MTFKEAIVKVLTNYANFSGRASRSEYWFFSLFNFVVAMAFSLLTAVTEASFFSVLAALFSLAMFIPSLAVTWRRLHDIGKSGDCYFIALVPLVGAILLLIWLATDSQSGENAYGPNPKE